MAGEACGTRTWKEYMTPQQKLADLENSITLFRKNDEHQLLEEIYGTPIGIQNLEWLINRVKQLEKALEFYADSYTWGDGNGLSWTSTKGHFDRGAKARKALAGEDE